MNRDELIKYICQSKIKTDWHWFKYHFNYYCEFNITEPFAESIIYSCLLVDKIIPGFSQIFIDDIASLSGKPSYQPHYEQLMQKIAELFIFAQISRLNWSKNCRFEYEPHTDSSKKNPEINILEENYTVSIEIKCPSLLKHIQTRQARPTQLSARDEALLSVAREMHGDNVTLPRDNPIKDFLQSAQSKFQQFNSIPNIHRLLFIVWDDFVYEPVTALLSPFSGLLTEKSFARDTDDNPIQYPDIDGIILIRQLHQFIAGSKELPLYDNKKHALDYGSDDSFPPKVLITKKELPEFIINGFHLTRIEGLKIFAEYNPSDFLLWI